MAKTLKGFLYENAIKKDNVLYIASKRFVDENGKPIEWELAPLDVKTVEKIQARHQKRVPIKGTQKYELKTDQNAIMLDMALESIKYPNLNDEELQNSWGVIGNEDLLLKMLSPGELTDLYMAINQACDFDAGMEDKIKTVKNS